MPDHKAIVDAELHEPKGALNAAEGAIYVSDGVGSGSWQRSQVSDHGEMTITNNATATVTSSAADSTLNLDSDYVKITAGWGNPHGHGVTFNVDELVVTVDGHYDLSFWSSILIPKNGNFFAIKYAVDDGTPYSLQKMVSQSATANDYRTMAGHGGVDLVVGQTVSVYIASTQNDSIVIEEAGLSLHLIHEN